ncbi:DnaD domain protein [Margalitia sp. FSL K6-0131]|uniref:DnaD domain protein n=1 Tax=Margalitia sp. FSL K6-0131 TaxID=2954604 RepID=UPI004046ABA0
MEELSKWMDDLSSEMVIEAMHRSVEKNKPWAYARKILKNWCKQTKKRNIPSIIIKRKVKEGF